MVCRNTKQFSSGLPGNWLIFQAQTKKNAIYKKVSLHNQVNLSFCNYLMRGRSIRKLYAYMYMMGTDDAVLTYMERWTASDPD